jgi:hypothetical protein
MPERVRQKVVGHPLDLLGRAADGGYGIVDLGREPDPASLRLGGEPSNARIHQAGELRLAKLEC